MIVESPAALRLVAALMDLGALGATREHLIRKADIGTTSFYRLIHPLIEQGIVAVDGNRYRVPLDTLYGFRFKLWHDAERLYRLAGADRSAVLDLVSKVRQALGEKLACLWLVGSAAQNDLGPTSDLDFLAVTTGETRFHPPAGGSRPVNFVVMSATEFRERHQRLDGFIESALRYGVLLFDRDFAQGYYAAPMPAALPASAIQAEEKPLDQLRTRALALVEHDLGEARNALRAYAVSVGRLMMRAFGELPRSREALVTACAALFGTRFAASLQKATQPGTLNGAAIIACCRTLADYHHAFQSHLSHLIEFAVLPTAEDAVLESMSARILAELVPRNRLLVQVKSSSEMPSREQLSDMFSTLARGRRSDRDARGLVILNACRDLPPLERPDEFPESARKDAARRHVILLSGLDLLRAHNVLHLESKPARTVFQNMIKGAS